MIYLFLSKSKLKKDLVKLLDINNLAYQFIDIEEKDSLAALYDHKKEPTGIVVESPHPSLPIKCWIDVLSSLCRRIPIVIASKDSKYKSIERNSRAELLTWLQNPKADEILSVLDSCGSLGLSHRLLLRNKIPYHNPMLAVHMLQLNGSLSLLCIQAEDFRKIATEYGVEAYHYLQDCFQQILLDLWGTPQSFRKGDILCRTSQHSNTFYILLEQSRSQNSIPPPGALEKVSDRLMTKIQGKLWAEITKPESKKMLPASLKMIPKFSIGHATGLYNPCSESEDIVESIIDSSKIDGKNQLHRIVSRERELIQALIKTKESLSPHYQGVFSTVKLDIEDVKEAIKKKSIEPVASSLYAFESLIRINKKQADVLINKDGPSYLDSKYLVPDILFSMASSAKLALELDQTCLSLATKNFEGLPGKLLANILPRNFYHIDKLQQLLPEDTNLIFEVSESEAINNFSLLLKAKERISKQNFGIAIDDFGSGYSSLEHILKIKPDIIKLDRCLVQNIHCEESKKAFVLGIINAAKITHSLVLAEGIELLEELETVMDLGVDLIQGYLIHKPQAVSEIRKDLDSNAPKSLAPVA